MSEVILGMILLICVVLLIAGLRISIVVTREVLIISTQVQTTLTAVSTLLKNK